MYNKQQWSLLSFYFFLAFIFQFPSITIRFWLIETVRVTPAQMMAITGITSIPWCLKPIYGFISDSYPLCGFRRRSYMVVMACLASLSWFLMTIVPMEDFAVTALLTLGSFSMCFVDVLADSLLVMEVRKEKENEVGTIQSWSWGIRFSGGLLASALGGVAYENIGARGVFFINGLMPVFVICIALIIKEDQPKTVTNTSNTRKQLLQAFKTPEILKPAIFMFILCATPGCGGPMTFFYERVLKFSPNEFAILDVLSYVFSIVGTVLYQRYLRHVEFRKIFLSSLTLVFLLENTMLMLVTRANLKYGVPDFTFAVIERICLTLAGQFVQMPMVVLGARLCPPGIEGTLYASLMSVSNFGDVLSNEWGSMFANMFGVTSTNFNSLWKLMLLCNAFDLVPIFSVFLISNKVSEFSSISTSSFSDNDEESSNGSVEDNIGISHGDSQMRTTNRTIQTTTSTNSQYI